MSASAPLTIIESPFAGNIEQHTIYARRALRDSLIRGEAPLAFHLLYTQALDDDNPAARKLGFSAGEAWYPVATRLAVYADYGISPGMEHGISIASGFGLSIQFRRIGLNPEPEASILDYARTGPNSIAL